MLLRSAQISCIIIVFILSACKTDGDVVIIPPVITSFTPETGEPGNQITIQGEHFGSQPAFFINDVEASVIFPITENQVTITVPANCSSGKIKVQNDKGTALSSTDFVIIGSPIIESFTPTTGNTGTTVVITGENFTASSKVKFNDENAIVVSFTPSSITTTVPSYSRTGKITVTTAGGIGISTSDFIANPQTITSITSSVNNIPLTVTGPGHRLYIKGTNFSKTASENIVKFNGLDVHMITQFNITDQLEVILPSGISTGKVTLTIGNYTFEYSQEIEVPSGEWKRTEDFPQTRTLGIAFSIGNDGYYGGGETQKDFWKFNGTTKTWSSVADIGVAGRRSYSFPIGDKAYVAGVNIFKLWEYNSVTNTWTEKGNATILSAAASFVINNKAYAVASNSTPTSSLYEYDPITDKWTEKTAFPIVGIVEPACFVVNGKAYVGTGVTGGSTFRKELWEYDPVTNLWTRKADFPGAGRMYTIGFSINGIGYMGAGQAGINMNFDDMYQYNVTTNEWRNSVPYVGAAVTDIHFLAGSKVYSGLIGGPSSGANWLYEFTP